MSDHDNRIELARVVMQILDDWEVTPEDQSRLLALPEKTRPRSLKRYRQGDPLPDDRVTQRRMSCVGAGFQFGNVAYAAFGPVEKDRTANYHRIIRLALPRRREQAQIIRDQVQLFILGFHPRNALGTIAGLLNRPALLLREQV